MKKKRLNFKIESAKQIKQIRLQESFSIFKAASKFSKTFINAEKNLYSM